VTIETLLQEFAPRPPGTYRTACPVCDRGPRDKAVAVTVEHDGGVVALCHRCGATAGRRQQKETVGLAKGGQPYQRRPTGPDEGPVDKPPPTLAQAGAGSNQYQVRCQEGTAPPTLAQAGADGRLADWAARLWGESRPIRPGTVAAKYLQARGCMLPPQDSGVRWHPDVRHSICGQSGPALVALVTDAVTNAPMSIHRTWITADGTKRFDPPRLLAHGHRKAGGVIRIWPDEDVTLGLAIGEGIETCLSIAAAQTPVWATVDAGNMAAFPVLAGIEALTICADRDPHGKGEAAARECAARWAEAGREVHVALPPASGDWNDWGGG